MSDVTLNAPTVAGGKVVKTKTIGSKEVQEVNYGDTTTRSTVTSTVDVEVLAATDRIRATFTNNSDQVFLLGEGTAAVTSSDYTISIPPGGYYAVDDTKDAFHGKFASAIGSGQLNVTEVT